MLEDLIQWFPPLFEKYGLFGLFIITVIGSSPIPIPVDLVVVSVVALGAPPIPTAIFAGFGASLGAIIFYYTGSGLINATDIVEKHKKSIERAKGWLSSYGAISVFLFAVLPLPYDGMAVAAGAVGMGFQKFYVATLLGRLLRYFIVAEAGFSALRYLSLGGLL